MHTYNSFRIIIYYYANAIEYLFVYYVLLLLLLLGLTHDIKGRIMCNIMI